jgi:thermitase
MKYKAITGIMLTLLLTGMLTLIVNVPPIVADNGINELLDECSTFQDSFLYDGSKNHSFDWNALEEENSRPHSVDDDKWGFNEINELSDIANVDGDSAELVIGVNNGKPNSYANIEGFVVENGGEFAGTISMGGEVRAVVADIPLTRVPSFVTEVRATGLSRYIEPNIKFQANFVPNDPYWLQQWGPRIIEADYAWNTTLGNYTVLVAVVDTGVDWAHPDLSANYVALGYDWVNDDMDPMDDNGHGTHCAGIIAAGINNSIGIAGLAQVRIMAEKALDDYGTGYSEDLANAIIHAVDCGALILSSSWGGYFESELIHEAVLYAYNSGALVVAAAGNDKTASKLYPAAYKEVVAVAATNQSDKPASWTNFGDWIELAAPGVDIYSTISKTHYFEFSYPYDHLSGTSMAAPHVAGVAALTWSQFPHMTRDQVWTQLRYAADDLGDQGFDWNYGWGRINARRAVEQAPTEHDLVIWDWDILPALEPWDLLTINTTVFNFGKMDESNITVRLLVNGSIVDSTHISFLESNTMTTVSCSWIPMVEGIYNITSYVVPVPGETITIYNARSRNVRVKVGKFFEVPTDYSTIQDAINSASPGYTILVESGIYYEHVVIHKSLKLIGEDRSTTIIDGSGIGAVVEVAAEDVYVSGFTIRNGGKEGMSDCGILTRQYAGMAIINNTVTNQSEGIVFMGSYGTNKIIGNTVVSHDDAGIAFIFSDGNYIIDGNTIENASIGIAIGALWGINIISGTISNNTVTSTDCGISLISSEGTVRDNKVINNYRGIDLARSGGSTLRDNNMTGNIHSLRVSDPLSPSGFFLDIDTSNTVDGKPVYFLVNQRKTVIDPSTFPDIGYLGIVNSTNVIVRGLNMAKNGEGVLLACTTGSTIENVNASENEVGISLSFCSSVTVVGNTVTNNQASGVFLFRSNNSVVSGNTVTNNTDGIWLYESSENTLSGNNITTNSREGIWLLWSSNNSMSGNKITNNSDNGIFLYGSSSSIIFGNNITNSWTGILFDGSLSNIISRNNITNNTRGIFLYGSLKNTLTRNNITNNHNGIWLRDSSSNIVSTNNMTNNVHGVYLDIFDPSGSSSNNKFYHNNFINNTVQAYVDNSFINVWDNGYPSGGNYWSDHNPPDIYGGPHQNETGGDGIGDTPYIIDGSNLDNYPLVRPYVCMHYVPTIDVNEDGMIDIVDIVIVALAFGSKPGDPNWNPYVDLNQDGIVDIVDLVMVALHFGETYP